MDIPTVPVDIIARDRMGNKVLITDDVCNVAKDLYDIDKHLKVRWSELGEYFVVYLEVERADGSTKQDLVTTSYELDQRIVERVRKISHEKYNFSKELDKLEKQAQKDKQHKFDEDVGAVAERLAHALRDDLGYKTDAQFAADVRWRSGKS